MTDIHKIALDTLKAGAPGLSDRTKEVLAGIIARKAAISASPAPAGAGLDREAVDLIDPKGWETRDGQYKAITGSTMHDKDRPLAFANADYYTRDSLAKADAILSLAAPEAKPEGEGVKADFTRSHPSGLDDSTYEKIEDALDRADAPIAGPDGNFLTLAQRVEALSPPSADADKLLIAREALEYIDDRRGIAPTWVQRTVRDALARLSTTEAEG